MDGIDPRRQGEMMVEIRGASALADDQYSSSLTRRAFDDDDGGRSRAGYLNPALTSSTRLGRVYPDCSLEV